MIFVLFFKLLFEIRFSKHYDNDTTFNEICQYDAYNFNGYVRFKN